MIPVTTQQFYQETTAYYEGRGIVNRAQRDWSYLTRQDQSTLFYFSIAGIFSGATVGAIYGIKAAQRIARLYNLSPPKERTAVVVGAAGGFVVGGGMAAAGIGIAVENKTDFVLWNKKELDKKFRVALRERFEKDQVLVNFVCPISRTPIIYPVRSPAGNLYEWEDILASADTETHLIKDPLRNTDSQGNMFFHKNALLEDHEAALVVEKRLKCLIEEDLLNLDPDSQEYKTLDSHRNFLKQTIRSEYAQELQVIQERREAAETDSMSEEDEIQIQKQYESELKDFKDLFGNTGLQGLNWTRDWPTILNQRWKLFPH